MQTIHRFNVSRPVIALDVPEGAEIVGFGVTSAGPAFWAKVDPEAPKSKRVFASVKTGESIPEKNTGFLGSCITPGRTAFHLFDMPADTKIPEYDPCGKVKDGESDSDDPDDDDFNE